MRHLDDELLCVLTRQARGETVRRIEVNRILHLLDRAKDSYDVFSFGTDVRRFGVFEECRCTMRKCTFEFRLVNTTANTRKLHAYLALTQALVAKAISMDDLDESEDFPEMLFIQTAFKDMAGEQQEAVLGKWESRLRWMVQELPLTEDELSSLRYCVEHSEVSKLGEQITDDIFNTTITEEVAA